MKKKIIKIGVIVKTHGIKGNLVVNFYSNNVNGIVKYTKFFDKSGREINLKIESKQVIKNKINDLSTDQLRCIVHIEGIDDCQKAQSFVGCELFINRDEIDLSDREDEFLISDLIGMEIYLHETENKIGIIEAVHDFGGGPMIEIASEIKEYALFKMLSFTNELFPQVDLSKKIAYLNFNPAEVVELNDSENCDISDKDAEVMLESWVNFKNLGGK